MAEKSVVSYIGDDQKYFDNIKKRFAKYFSSLPLDFIMTTEKEPKKIQSLIKNIMSQNPKIIFIDFSKNFEDMLHLARIITRTNPTKRITTIGLLDQNQTAKQVKECYLSGLLVCHIKSTELHDVVFDSVAMAYPDKTPEHGFVRAKLNDYLNVFELAKIGFVTPNQIHLECNRAITSGSNVILNHFWFENQIIPSQRMVVTKKSEEGLFYNYKNALDLEFMYIDPYIPVEGDEEEYVNQKQMEDEEKIDQVMANFDKWFEQNIEQSHPKIMRVLVIDKEMKLYEDQEKTDAYTFMLRLQPTLEEPSAELKKLAPQIIFYEIQRVDENDSSGIENSFKALKEMVLASRDIQNYEPFFVVLNTRKEMTEKLRTDYNYPNIICHESNVTKEIVIQLSKMLESKVRQKYKGGGDQPIIYLKKTNPVSIAELVFPITLSQLSETDMVFSSQVPMKPFTTFRLEIPANMFITTLPNSKIDKSEIYAVIHGISEIEKMKLRQFINSVFFREKEAAKNQEKQALEQKKQKVLQDKVKASQPPAKASGSDEEE